MKLDHKAVEGALIILGITATIVLCILILAGCSSPLAITLHVSPDFTHQERAEVLRAASDWNAALGTVALSPVVDACPGDGACIEPSRDESPSIVIGTTRGDGRGTTTTLYLDRMAAVGVPVHLTALHELGHAMGLVHHAPGTAMAADAHVQADYPTADDVEQWKELQP